MAQEKWLVQPGESRTIDVELVRTLKIGFIGGQIDVIAHDEPGARVEVHSVQGRDLKITIDGDRLEIDHPQLRWDNFIEVFKSMRSNAKADVSVLVPRDVALKFGVVSATALISGLHTDARLSTVSGDVVADGLVGDIELNSVSGELSVRDHSGRINAHTVSGDVTVSGSIRKLAVDGVSGDVMADISGTPDEIAINTVSGDSTIRIPEAIGARYRANTVSGRVQLDNVVIVGSLGKGYTGTAGSLDGSWVDINVNSVSGAVSVLRGPSAAQESARQGGEGASA
ncbi:DUF4097 family beta strand repeat-containing protein [Leifsonia aquatica]|uniref:DUF4097 family beta strand repeat-containing protein n=1 Tax=Leifsonia aquatica TaxID=144185 RepID=UPI00382FDA5E